MDVMKENARVDFSLKIVSIKELKVIKFFFNIDKKK